MRIFAPLREVKKLISVNFRMEREQSDSQFCGFCDFCVPPKYAQIHEIRGDKIINMIKQMKQFTCGNST